MLSRSHTLKGRTLPAKRVVELGFTLIELMVVVLIVGVFLLLAAPRISSSLQDQHAKQAAEDVAGVLRLARVRASATGSAHNVIITGTGLYKFEVRAAVDTVGTPSASCVGPKWDATDSQSVESIDFNTSFWTGKDIAFTSVPAATGFCFTPGGQLWQFTGVWLPVGGSASSAWSIQRKDAAGALYGNVRTVRFGPTGIPRILVAG